MSAGKLSKKKISGRVLKKNKPRGAFLNKNTPPGWGDLWPRGVRNTFEALRSIFGKAIRMHGRRIQIHAIKTETKTQQHKTKQK